MISLADEEYSLPSAQGAAWRCSPFMSSRAMSLRDFTKTGLVDHTRLSLFRSTLRMIADRPWFGTGLGTFNLAFPAYRSDDISM